MLFDWLITGQVLDANPAAAVRAAKHVVKKGKTPVLKADDARELLDTIPLKIGPEPKEGEEDNRPPKLSGLRDRALIAVMVYSFARVTAALGMKVEDYYTGHRYWLRPCFRPFFDRRPQRGTGELRRNWFASSGFNPSANCFCTAFRMPGAWT